MTALYDDGSAEPRTHALVVGVGEYDYIDDPRVAGLNLTAKLSSPPESALAFATFLRDELTNSEAPLGSLDLLVSPTRRFRPPGSARAKRIGRPTMEELRPAFRQWVDRCNRNEDNVAMFYFCGHGLMRGHLGLLVADFGDPDSQPFANAINFDDSRVAMATSCRAKIQCFFADACRQVSLESLRVGNELGEVIPDWLADQNLAVDSFGLYATLPTDPAYGQVAGVAAFTQAILASFRGMGCRPRRGAWWVSTSHLAEGVEAAMSYAQAHEGAPRQTSQPEGGRRESLIHCTDSPGDIPVTIMLVPGHETDGVELSIFEAGAGQPVAHRLDGAEPWHIRLPVKEYQGRATFSRRWRPYEATVNPQPPHPEIAWELEE